MCHLCNAKPVYEFTNKRKLCRNCFIHWFEKKFLFINRKFNMIKKGDIIAIKGEGYKKEALKYVLDNFKNKLMIKINNKGNKIAISDTIGSESNKIIDVLINKNINKSPSLKPINNKIIKPLYLFTDEEVLLYAKLKGLKYKPSTKKIDNLTYFLNNLEQKHPEVKRAVVNSYLKFS